VQIKKVFLVLFFCALTVLFLSSCDGSGVIFYPGPSGNLILTVNAFHDMNEEVAIKVFINGIDKTGWYFFSSKTLSVNDGDRITAKVRFSTSESDCLFYSEYGWNSWYTTHGNMVFDFYPDHFLVQEGYIFNPKKDCSLTKKIVK